MKRIRLFGLLTLVFVLLVSAGCGEKPRAALLEVRFLDVGQGDCVLFRTDAGDVLIDAGTENSQESLCRRLRNLGVTELELLIVTHPDEDHIGGADGVLRAFPTAVVWTNGAASGDECMARFSAATGGCRVLTVGAGVVGTLGSTKFEILAPADLSAKDANDQSLIVRVTCGETALICTGDAGVAEERALLASNPGSLACDVCKIGHHGSNTSSSREFLEAMTPAFAVVSCGAGNPYGHPHGEVLARLEALGSTVLRTDRSGEIVFTTDGETLTLVSPTP